MEIAHCPTQFKGYRTMSPKRYPDPANLLPISADAYIFVHRIMKSELTWNERSKAGERIETQGRKRKSKRGQDAG
jgi:hypothetical protein